MTVKLRSNDVDIFPFSRTTNWKFNSLRIVWILLATPCGVSRKYVFEHFLYVKLSAYKLEIRINRFFLWNKKNLFELTCFARTVFEKVLRSYLKVTFSIPDARNNIHWHFYYFSYIFIHSIFVNFFKFHGATTRLIFNS